MKRNWTGGVALFLLALLIVPPHTAASSEAPTSSEASPEPAEGASPEPVEGAGDDADDKDKKPTRVFDRVTVTATGSKTNTQETPVSVTVINQDEIDRRIASSPADLLRGQPGVDLNGIGPNQVRPVIRGLRGQRVLFLQNGLRVNNPRRTADFGEITGLISLSDAQQIEVVRGPASVLYGSDAIGGVLNVITSEPNYADGTLGGEVGARFSTNDDQQNSNATLGGRFGKVRFEFGVTVRDFGDYEAPDGTFGDISLDDDIDVEDTGLDDDTLFGKLLFDITDNQTLTFEWNRYRAEQTGFGLVEPADLGDPFGSRVQILYPFQDFDRYALGYRAQDLTNPVADSFNVDLFHQSNERELVNNIDIPIVAGGFPIGQVAFDTTNFTDVDTVGFRGQGIKQASRRNTITYGVEYTFDDSENTDFSVSTTTGFGPPIVSVDTIANTPNAENTAIGIFAQDEFQATERLTLTFGARWTDVETKAQSTPGLDTTGLDFSDDQLVGAASALYRIGDRWRATASYGTAFRAPNIIERLFNGPTPEGFGFQIINEELESETSENAEIGFKYQSAKVFAEVTLFNNEVDDALNFVELTEDEKNALPAETQQAIIDSFGSLEDAIVIQNRNIDELEIQGVELAGAYRMDNGLLLGANYTHLDQDFKGENDPTDQSANDIASAYALYQPAQRRYWAEYRVRYNGDQRAGVSTNPIGDEIPDFFVHSLGVGYRVPQDGLQHEFSVAVQNLFDELYTEASNASFFRPEPGRNFVFNYRLRY